LGVIRPHFGGLLTVIMRDYDATASKMWRVANKGQITAKKGQITANY